MAGIEKSRHLKAIDDDQSISGITTLWATLKNQIGRKWWASQEVKPTIPLGVYNSTSGRYEPIKGSQLLIQDTTSLDTYTLTVPAGHRYIVRYVSATNGTTNTTWAMDLVIDGVTLANVTPPQTANIVAGNPCMLVGSPMIVDSLGNINPGTPSGIIELNPGDQLSTFQAGFVALDVIEINVVVEDITLE